MFQVVGEFQCYFMFLLGIIITSGSYQYFIKLDLISPVDMILNTIDKNDFAAYFICSPKLH